VKVLQPPPYIRKTVALLCVFCVYGIVHGLECLDTNSGTRLNALKIYGIYLYVLPILLLIISKHTVLERV
jgi:hypothetical protein